MNSLIMYEIATQRIADLHRDAAVARRAAAPAVEPPRSEVMALRLANGHDRDELTALAALDSQRPLAGDVLTAVVDGRMVAAIALGDRRVIADPMVRTADARALLEQRAEQIQRGARPKRRLRRRLRPRWV